MYLSDLFDQLTYGELSQMEYGGADNVGITEPNFKRIIPHINLALTSIYTKFPLRTEEVIVKQYEHIQTYTLDRKYAQTNTESEFSPRYIMDSEFEPFHDNVLKIERIYDELGRELFSNDDTEYWTIWTPEYNSFQIPYPDPENALSIEYRADHPRINLVNLDPSTTEVRIPPQLVSAVCFFIASRVHGAMAGEGHTQVANNYMQKYEMTCNEMINLNVFNKQIMNNLKLEVAGWV